MYIWNAYYQETSRREYEIAEAMQDRYLKSVAGVCESRLTRLSIQALDLLGSKLVQWGEQLQCRCAELALTRSKRAA
jgi:hypothetical protein